MAHGRAENTHLVFDENGKKVKQKTDFKAIKKLLLYAKSYMLALVVAIVLAVASAIFTIIGPEKISEITDAIAAGIFTNVDIDLITDIAFSLVFIYAMSAISGYAQQFITATVTQKIAKRLRYDLDNKINKLPLAYFDKSTKGDLLSRFTNDIDTIAQALSNSTANLISSMALFLGVIYKMFSTNVILALVTIGTSVFGFAFMGIVVGKSQKYFNQKQKDLGVMNGQIEEVYTNHKIVRAFGARESEIEKFEETNEKLFGNNWKSQFLSGLTFPMINFINNLSYVLIFAVGIAYIVDGNTAITIGVIMAFVVYSKLFGQPLSTFAQSVTALQPASAAAKRVFEVLDAEEMNTQEDKISKLVEVRGDVEFRNVKFGYEEGKPIIKDFSASLKAGQKVAIVGPTGAGKTTIVNLLMKFYEVDGGDILIDGVSINDIKREDIHDLFDMILQDTWLFSGTLLENLRYNNENASMDEVRNAVKAAGLEHFVASLTDGYDTIIDESLSLSEGQKQQLTIARAIIKDAPLLILDEATSSVDTRTEIVIQRAMDDLTKGRTSFVIAHRLSTVKNADVILVMNEGDIIEQGSHEELLMRGGFYAELYNSQFVEA